MEVDRLEQAFLEATRALDDSGASGLDPFGVDFGRRVFATPASVYLDRVEGYGFSGLGRVLDVGCGLGQWSFALAEVNEIVTGVDVEESRTEFATRIAEKVGLANCSFDRRHAGDTIANGPFDGIFCFGVLPLVPWRETVSWMWSMLNDNGLLYVNANGLGWYKYLWYSGHNAGSGYDPQERASVVLSNTLRYDRTGVFTDGQDVLIEPADLIQHLGELGAVDTRVGPEGSLVAGITTPRPFFRESYLGDLGVYEVLARKCA